MIKLVTTVHQQGPQLPFQKFDYRNETKSSGNSGNLKCIKRTPKNKMASGCLLTITQSS